MPTAFLYPPGHAYPVAFFLPLWRQTATQKIDTVIFTLILKVPLRNLHLPLILKILLILLLCLVLPLLLLCLVLLLLLLCLILPLLLIPKIPLGLTLWMFTETFLKGMLLRQNHLLWSSHL